MSGILCGGDAGEGEGARWGIWNKKDKQKRQNYISPGILKGGGITYSISADLPLLKILTAQARAAWPGVQLGTFPRLNLKPASSCSCFFHQTFSTSPTWPPWEKVNEFRWGQYFLSNNLSRDFPTWRNGDVTICPFPPPRSVYAISCIFRQNLFQFPSWKEPELLIFQDKLFLGKRFVCRVPRCGLPSGYPHPN